MNSCPKESFLRNGKPHDVPARFQIWVRRTTRRAPLIERKNHPDLTWVPKSRSAEATIWICRRGPDLGNIIEAIGITTPPEDYYGIRCSLDAVAILRSIRWRDVLDPLPSNHPPNMSQADIRRAYVQATENAKRDANDDDHAITVPTKLETASRRHRAPQTKLADLSLDQRTSSASPSTSPQPEGAQKSTDGGVLSDKHVVWWWQRIEQFTRDLRPVGPLIANIQEEVIDDQRSNFVVQFTVAMRPMQAVLPTTLFISACHPNESA